METGSVSSRKDHESDAIRITRGQGFTRDDTSASAAGQGVTNCQGSGSSVVTQAQDDAEADTIAGHGPGIEHANNRGRDFCRGLGWAFSD